MWPVHPRPTIGAPLRVPCVSDARARVMRALDTGRARTYCARGARRLEFFSREAARFAVLRVLIAMPSPAQPSPVAARGRLHFLDGLRGLACLYVLLFHELSNGLIAPNKLNPVLKCLHAWLNYGRLSVVFFIVLSGFSLMLPIARAGTGRLLGGFRGYIYRRARRILPPYYAALVLSAGMILAFNLLGPRFGLGQKIDDAALETGSVVSHLLLLHNLRFGWAYRINGPMWSVATEWQIYFIFAAALLPLYRRFGAVVTCVVGWVVGALPFFLLPPDRNLFWACPWFIGSFAMGMWAALIGFSPSHRESALRNRAPWQLLTVLCFGTLVCLAALGFAASWPYPVVDLVVSFFAFSWINACVAEGAGENESHGFVLRLLSSRPLVYLGGFSYSLYLVQHPMLKLIEKAEGRLHLSDDGYAILQLVVTTPVVMAAAWLFSELFERPFTVGGILLPALRRRSSVARPQAS
jgi:peptidoglycan/LPS O-acetylase OafA/YrhL